MTTRIQLRRGIAAQWTSADPVLALGEAGVETDTLLWKVGDGTTVWSELPYMESANENFGNVTVSGNISAGNILTNNYLYANGQPYGGSGSAAGNAGDIQINVAGGLGADSTLRYVDNGGEMTLYADYLNAPGIFTSDIYAGDGSPSNLTLTTSYGNAAWTFGADGTTVFPSYTFPNVDGTAGQVFATNGSGTIYWANAGSGGSVYANTVGSFGSDMGIGPNYAGNDPAILFGEDDVLIRTGGTASSGGQNYGELYLAGSEDAYFGQADNLVDSTYPTFNTSVFANSTAITLAVPGPHTMIMASDGTFTYDGNNIIGGGTANTGNITFNDINIIGTGNLHLQPDSTNASAYLDIYLTYGPDIHIAGNGENVIVGRDDGANVTVNTNGNVTIQSWNGTANTWSFGNDGTFVTPGVSGNITGANVVEANTVTANTFSSPGNLQLVAGEAVWTFDNTGNLTLPGAVGFNNSSAVIQSIGPVLQIAGNIQTNQNTLGLPVDGGDTFLSANANVNLQSGIGGTNYEWSFGVDGNLILPRGGVIYETNIPSGFTANTIALAPSGGSNIDQQLLVYPTVSADANHLHLTSGNVYNTELFLGNDDLYVKLANTGNVVINSFDPNVVAPGHTWTFANNGNLNLPQGGYIGPVDVKGFGTMLTGGPGNLTSLTSYYADAPGIYSSCVTVNADGTLNITTYGNGTGQLGQWIFSGASLSAPGNISLNGGYIDGGVATVVTDGINSIALSVGAQMDVFTFPFTVVPTRGQLTISGDISTTEALGTWYYQATATNTYQLYTDSTYTTLVDASGWTAYGGGGVVAITLQDPATNIVINSNGFTSTFTNTGELDLPGAVNIAGTGGDITMTGGSITGAVAVITTPTSYANLITPVAGARAFINDGNLVAAGNFGVVISNGGSNTVPVWSDGTDWYIG